MVTFFFFKKSFLASKLRRNYCCHYMVIEPRTCKSHLEGIVASEMQCPDKGANSFQHSTHQSETRTTANLSPTGAGTQPAQLWQDPHIPWHYMEEPHVCVLLPLNEGDEFSCIQGKARASQDQFPDQCL